LRKEIVAFAVLTCLLLTSIQTVFASSVSTTATYGPYIAPGGPYPTSPFDAAFIEMTGANVTFNSGTYTFGMNVSGTPGDWMTSTWQPTFASPHQAVKLTGVGYNWIIYDASGHFLAALDFYWLKGTPQTIEVRICPAGADLGCVVSVSVTGVGLGRQIYTNTQLNSLSALFYQGSNSVILTISQSDLNGLPLRGVGGPAYWRGFSWACHMTAPESNSCVAWITDKLTLPTT
jgi:hypothetical protein